MDATLNFKVELWIKIAPQPCRNLASNHPSVVIPIPSSQPRYVDDNWILLKLLRGVELTGSIVLTSVTVTPPIKNWHDFLPSILITTVQVTATNPMVPTSAPVVPCTSDD